MSIIKSTAQRLYELENERKKMARQMEEQQAISDYIAMMADVDIPTEEEGGDDEPEV